MLQHQRIQAAARRVRAQGAGGELAHYDNPIDFIQREMYIPETPGIPMVLHEEVRRVLGEMFAFDGDLLRYITMVYSSIKKSGKCAIIDSMIQMADGTRKRAEDVRPGDRIIAWDGKRCVAATVSGVQEQAPEPLIRVTTKRGRSLVTTAHHPYLVRGDRRPPAYAANTKSGLQDRWVKASELKPKDAVRIALDYAESKSCDLEEMWLLGLYVGDGAQGNISSNCDEVLTRIRQRYDLVHRGQYDYFIKGAQDFLRKHGMLKGSSANWKNYCNSHTKRIPDTVFSAGREGIIAFLSGYLDSDGEVSNKRRKQPAIIWSSINRDLLSDCQDLLAAIGFNATLFRDDAKFNGKKYESWRLALYGRNQVTKIAKLLNLTVPHKRQLLEWWAAKQPQYVANVYEVDRVVCVEYVEPDKTIAIEVEDYHTHVTEGIITHNTTICAGIALWQAYRIDNGEIYIVGNDLKQADSRMNQAIRYCIMHNPRMADVKVNRNTSYLPNGTRIEAVPVDARGEAGSNPTGIFWTEIWGAKDRKHEEMWSEMALSPTRQGRSFKLCESYAGHSGESNILERLYTAVVKPENVVNPDISPELYASGGTVVYWNTRRYLDWQHGEAAEAYYAQEAKEKTPNEFLRVHRNQWVTSGDVFVPIEWWDSLKAELPPLGHYQQVVVGIDAAVSGDCFAMVAVSRDANGKCQVRRVRTWTPPTNGKIQFRNPSNPNDPMTPEGVLRGWCREWRVAEVCYDEYQLHSLCSDLYAEGIAYFRAFPQGADRLTADKMLFDIIREGRIVHDGDAILREHISNANHSSDKESSKLRIIKRNESLKIDACVSLSMAVSRALYLNVT